MADDTVYQVQMRTDLEPYRVDVEFKECREVEVQPLLSEFGFIENEDAWGVYFRRSLFEISERDFRLPHDQMSRKES